jgi:hypothetical protein
MIMTTTTIMTETGIIIKNDDNYIADTKTSIRKKFLMERVSI